MEHKTKKPHLGIVVLGHVDAGKSTTMGHLILECGGLNEKILQRIEEEALRRKNSSKYAFVMEYFNSERERGITVDVKPRQFNSIKYLCTIMDAPGHRDFIKNMIVGTSAAEVAMLVVSSVKAEFEAGVGKHGQTREHVLLAHTLGIRQMLVLVNKMDSSTTNYSQERYKPEEITFVPVSGWTGENLTKKSDKLHWYTGPTLLEAIDNLTEPKSLKDLPLRVTIQDVYRIAGIGTVPVGRIETGVLTTTDKITVAPGNLTSEVKAIEMFHTQMVEATPGDNVGICVRGLLKKDMHRGSVIGHTYNEPPSEAVDFIAHIIVLNHPSEIRVGYAPLVDCHTSHVPCKFTELLVKYDRRIGKEIQSAPNVESLKKGDAALVRLEPMKPMVVEAFSEFAPLGRFAVVDNQRTVAVGIIKSVNKKSHTR